MKLIKEGRKPTEINFQKSHNDICEFCRGACMNKFMPVSARKLRLLTKKNGRTHRCAPTRLPTYGAKLISVQP